MRGATQPTSIQAAADRLLTKLGEAGVFAIRCGNEVTIRKEKSGVSLGGGLAFPMEALAALASDGAVRCETKAGKSRYLISSGGKARLERRNAGLDAPFADQHREIVTRQGDGETPLRVNLRADPLNALARQVDGKGVRLAGPAAIGAGERLRRDMQAAQIAPKTTSNWDRLVVDGAGPGNGLTLSERAMAARTRVEKALAAVGPDFANLLIDLCGFSRGIEEIEGLRGLPQRSGKVALAFGLRALARHYGLSEQASGTRSGAIQSWGSPDYRPELKRA